MGPGWHGIRHQVLSCVGLTLPNLDEVPDAPTFTGRDAVRVTPEGVAWVSRTVKGAAPTPVYDVFDGTGKLVRQVTLRPGSRVVGFGKGTLYVVRMNDDDLQYLERYRR